MPHFKFFRQVVLILFSCFLSAQAHKIETGEMSFEKLKALYNNNWKNERAQLIYANAYLAKANKENIPLEKARGWYLLSLLSNGEKAIRYLDSTIHYSKDLNDIKYPAYAFSRKAYELIYQSKYKEAIDNFLLAERTAKKNNIDFYYDVKYSIAVLRSEQLGEVNEALKLYRECFNYYKEKDVRSSKYSYAYQDVLFGLADAYKTLKQLDSATYFNKLGYKESKSTKDYRYNALFVLNEGANLVEKKIYYTAIDSINKALPRIISDKDSANTLASYYYLGKAYDGLEKKNLAVENFMKVDSIYIKTKKITPEFTSGYLFLISYFKNKNDKENQLKYLTRYMFIDSVLQTDYKNLSKKLQKEYDMPNLLLEKENLIKVLKNDKTTSYWEIGLLVALVVFSTSFGFYQRQIKKKQYSQFEKIMHNKSATDKKIVGDESTKPSKDEKAGIDNLGINAELVKQILEKLDHFETTKGYLSSNITIQSLSANFETNSKYISKVVNAYKEKSFIQYINDLRIEYALGSLKNDNKLRKYTIQALASEFGFNNAESFSNAFYKKSGIKPAYFIKELDKFPNL
ncbi:helix-turn-helix domain-containing protein [Flavobacterium hungaricum]|uniref:Helix-turn-helix domain-containing protein n=1 Tax=Flavobacterium hungaricum TaxID=2082725 RepID=A0ABR9TGV9_9FLAO|nr:helix-turn-helix domain-containing protein [Flavobacterium hungaricum]MBE8724574.1 helix-turn-helix domain-containing protein [Flavobacterium hungaricum]